MEIDGIKIDDDDTKNRVIKEVKKSNKIEKAHERQLKYYIYVFERNGIDGVTGILEYPTLRKKESVIFSELYKDEIKEIENKICIILESVSCPATENKSIFKKRNYLEFFFSWYDYI